MYAHFQSTISYFFADLYAGENYHSASFVWLIYNESVVGTKFWNEDH